jgi:NAD(P)-dependent dehydrogenase (short-subunit alcohol dehydrogenase family)
MVDQVMFDGDVVIVTGGAGGLGTSQALELARRGARVLVNDLGGTSRSDTPDPSLAQAVVDEIQSAGGEALASGESVSSEGGPAAIVEAALRKWGRVDGLIHNAAILRDEQFEDATDEDFDRTVEVNLRGTYRTVRAAYRAMKDTGGGRILTVTSNSGLSGSFGQSAYAATKMGVVGMTRSIAWEGSRYGIKANSLAPSAHDTRMSAVFTPDDNAGLRGRPEELEVDVRDTDFADLMTASRVTPLALALVHRSCPATSEIFGATGGYFCRFAISHTEGATFGPHPTVDDVVGGWDAIRGGTVPNELDGEALAWGVRAYTPRLAVLAEELKAESA